MTNKKSVIVDSPAWGRYVSRAAWALLTFMAIAVGIVSLRYLFPSPPFPITDSNLLLRRPWLLIHATCASLALMTGPWQFLPIKSTLRGPWHRWLGRGYLVAVLLGWISSIPIAAHAQTGHIASLGFLVLGIAWVITGTLAYTTILRRDVQAHRRWMVRNYALTCAAITLRVMIPLSAMAGISFRSAYPVIAWACWLINLAVVELWLNRPSSPNRISDEASLESSPRMDLNNGDQEG